MSSPLTSIELVGPAASIYVRSMRILLAEKVVPYRFTDGWPGHDGRPDHPFKLAPVLYVGDEMIFESRAIASYIDHGLAGLALSPREPMLAARYEQHVSLLLTYALPTMTRFTQAKYFPETRGLSGEEHLLYLQRIEGIFSHLDAVISPYGYLGGDFFGLCDAYFVPVLDYLSSIPETAAFLSVGLMRYRDAMAMRDSVASTRALLQ